MNKKPTRAGWNSAVKTALKMRAAGRSRASIWWDCKSGFYVAPVILDSDRDILLWCADGDDLDKPPNYGEILQEIEHSVKLVYCSQHRI